MAKERYPETQLLLQVVGVGTITATTFVLTVEDPARFSRCRKIGSYLGLRPRRDESGTIEHQLRITKAGDGALRSLLVSCSQYILATSVPTPTFAAGVRISRSAAGVNAYPDADGAGIRGAAQVTVADIRARLKESW